MSGSFMRSVSDFSYGFFLWMTDSVLLIRSTTRKHSGGTAKFSFIIKFVPVEVQVTDVTWQS